MDSAQLAKRIIQLFGDHSMHEVKGGYTPLLRRRIEFSEPVNIFGHLCTSCFIKAAVDEKTAQWILDEIKHTQIMQKKAWAPQMLGVIDETIIVYEDLGTQGWPPPLDAMSLDSIVSVLPEIWSHPAELSAVSLPQEYWAAQKEADLPDEQKKLKSLAADFVYTGEDSLHLDLRLDNLCLVPGRGPVFVDWNWASKGSRDLDIITLAVNIHMLEPKLDLQSLFNLASTQHNLRAGLAGYTLYLNYLTKHQTHFTPELIKLWSASAQAGLDLIMTNSI